MSSSSPAALLAVDVQPGRPPLLRAEPAGDPAGWVGGHRQALRAVLAEHGAVVRGLGLADPAGVGAVVRRLAGALMTERESFAPRRSYPDGVYSASKWPANQPMCMHHELSYALEFPGLMLFACLRAPTEGGATAVADAPTVLDALPAELVGRFEREGWLLARTYNEEIGASVAEAFGTEDRATVEGSAAAARRQAPQRRRALRTGARQVSTAANPGAGPRPASRRRAASEPRRQRRHPHRQRPAGPPGGGTESHQQRGARGGGHDRNHSPPPLPLRHPPSLRRLAARPEPQRATAGPGSRRRPDGRVATGGSQRAGRNGRVTRAWSPVAGSGVRRSALRSGCRPGLVARPVPSAAAERAPGAAPRCRAHGPSGGAVAGSG